MRQIASVLGVLALGGCFSNKSVPNVEMVPPIERPVTPVLITPPKLVVQITVDQLASRILARQSMKFEEGGFRRFIDQGAWFPSVLVDHAHTETVVGHTSLTTGAWPKSHGMIGNSWYSREANETVDATRSGDTILCGGSDDLKGASPEKIQVDTIGDILHQQHADAKVFAVSGKYRSGVAMGGHKGTTAFWYDSGAFVTSSFYTDTCPDWATAWLADNMNRFENEQWVLSRSEADYASDGDNTFEAGTPVEKNMILQEDYGFKRNFPHEYASTPYYQNFLMATPALDILTAEFALELVRQEGLGQDDVPDYLGLSFSAVDYVQHNFGEATRESEDVVYQLDRTLKALFDALDEEVGDYLVVVSADHGAAEYPAVLREAGTNAGWIPEGTAEAVVGAALTEKGWPVELVASYALPYLYIAHDLVEAEGLSRDEVIDVVATAVVQVEGIARAVPTAQVDRSASPFAHRISTNQHPERSGDVFVVLEEYWQQSNPGSTGFDLVQHSSPWTYDSVVPVGFFGPGVQVGVFDGEGVRTVDLMPTIGVFLGLNPWDRLRPEIAGSVLVEVFEDQPEL